MSERSLFERLRRPELERERRGADRASEVQASVLAHLRAMLNSRQGNAPAAPDYGVPDLTDLARGYPDSAASLERALQRSIAALEPRLASVEVRLAPPEDGSLTLAFEISARLVVGEGRAAVAFVTRVGPDGRVDVS
ncbi:MAG: type VI secretion system baseplate subunit TssE [Candidatus Polarisedimenticolia bacterium]|nr:type VI secretion system baseplate subunit TssE [bacterium]